MNITISFEIDGFTNNDDLIAWLNAGLTGEPVKRKRNRKPMTDEEKAAFRTRMVKGQEEAAKARNSKELSTSSKSAAAKKPVSKRKPAAKKKVKKKAKTS